MVVVYVLIAFLVGAIGGFIVARVADKKIEAAQQKIIEDLKAKLDSLVK